MNETKKKIEETEFIFKKDRYRQTNKSLTELLNFMEVGK